MSQKQDELISTLEKTTNLTVLELQEIRNNREDYMGNPHVREIIELSGRFTEIQEDLGELDTLRARKNFESYEKYMAVHTNAIALTGIRAKLALLERKLPENLSEEAEYFVKKYLLRTQE